MKSRLSYFLASGIIILSIFIGIFIRHHQHHQEASNFKEESFTAPISSKYIPTNADLVLHWKVNPTILPEYIENYQDRVKKNIVNKVNKLLSEQNFYQGMSKALNPYGDGKASKRIYKILKDYDLDGFDKKNRF